MPPSGPTSEKPPHYLPAVGPLTEVLEGPNPQALAAETTGWRYFFGIVYVLFGIFPFLVLSQAASKQEPSVKRLSKSNMQV